jgi:7,8-dihydropterin-6-yl-methyl-4-(beta-D-ribofuranosyl)aminobenzene 5'-phosphate synthase
VAALCIPAIGLKSAKAQAPATSVGSSAAQIRALKITVLSTMLVGDTLGLGEWGFSALVEADGHRILLDTGSHPETVLQNARDLNIDLSDVSDAILTHNHRDHVGGLMPLRREMMKKNPAALSVAHVSRGIFYSRPSPEGEQNEMIGIRKDYEASGGKCIEHAEGFDIFPGAWLTGPVPRKYPERNWSPGGKVQTPSGGSVARAQYVARLGSADRLRPRWDHQYFDLRETEISQATSVWSRRRPALVRSER